MKIAVRRPTGELVGWIDFQGMLTQSRWVVFKLREGRPFDATEIGMFTEHYVSSTGIDIVFDGRDVPMTVLERIATFLPAAWPGTTASPASGQPQCK